MADCAAIFLLYVVLIIDSYRADGSTTFNTNAPDTITSWVLSAFSVSDEYGLGIANTSQVIAFTLSLGLTLPCQRIAANDHRVYVEATAKL